MAMDPDELERLARAADARVKSFREVVDWSPEAVTGGSEEFAIPGVAYDMSEICVRFIGLANPAAVLDLVKRLRAAEAIVRDLAAGNEPLTDDQSMCTICEHWGHAESCPYRRAVEATR